MTLSRCAAAAATSPATEGFTARATSSAACSTGAATVTTVDWTVWIASPAAAGTLVGATCALAPAGTSPQHASAAGTTKSLERRRRSGIGWLAPASIRRLMPRIGHGQPAALKPVSLSLSILHANYAGIVRLTQAGIEFTVNGGTSPSSRGR